MSPGRRRARRLAVADGTVLPAGWHDDAQGAAAWLLDHEHVRIAAGSLQAAVTGLHALVEELTAGAEYTFEFVPALPEGVVGDDPEPDAEVAEVPAAATAGAPATATVRVDWTLLEDGETYRLWCVDRPELEARGIVFPLAVSDLLGMVWEADGARPQLVLVTPSPVRPTPSVDWARLRATAAPEWRYVVPNTSVRIVNRDAAFVGGGYCAECHAPLGARTQEPLVIGPVDAGHHAASAAFGLVGGPPLFSDAFLDALLPEERRLLVLRPTNPSRRTTRCFHELVGAAAEIPLALLPGVEPPAGCAVCGRPLQRWYKVVNAKGGKPLPFHYVGASALPADDAAMVVLQPSPHEHMLAFRADRWAALAKRPSSKGLKSYPLGILAG